MRKRILSILLTVCMVFSMMPMSAFAAEAETPIVISDGVVSTNVPTEPTVGGETTTGEETNTDAPAEPTIGEKPTEGEEIMAMSMLATMSANITNASDLAAALGGDNYATASDTTVTLQKDVTLEDTIKITAGTIILDLAGFTITGKAGADSDSSNGGDGLTAISVSGDADVTIQDNSTGGTIVGGNGGYGGYGGDGGNGLTVSVTGSGGTVSLSGGTFQGGDGGNGTKGAHFDGAYTTGGDGGSGLSVSGGTVTLNGGTFQGGNGGSGNNGGTDGKAISATNISSLISAGYGAYDNASTPAVIADDDLATATYISIQKALTPAEKLAKELNDMVPNCCEVDKTDSTKVNMLTNAQLTNTINITTGTIILDLAGKTITGKEGMDGAKGFDAISVSGNGTNFTVTDSIQEKNGKIIGGTGRSSNGGNGLSVSDSGNVTVSGGTFQGGNSDSMSSDNGGNGLSVSDSGSVTLSGGTFQGGKASYSGTNGKAISATNISSLISDGYAAYDKDNNAISSALANATYISIQKALTPAEKLAKELNNMVSNCCEVDKTDATKVNMLTNAQLTNTINITTGTIVLDLAGKTITGKAGSDSDSTNGGDGLTAISVSGDADVTIQDNSTGGTIVGGNGGSGGKGGYGGGNGGNGLVVIGTANLNINSGSIAGGNGGNGHPSSGGIGGNGGIGVTLNTTGGVTLGGNVTGGAGGWGGGSGGNGGTGLSLLNTADSVEVNGGTFTGGKGCNGGNGGNGLTVVTGSIEVSGGTFTGGSGGDSDIQGGKNGTAGKAISGSFTISKGYAAYDNAETPAVIEDNALATATYIKIGAIPPHTHCICGGKVAVGDHTSHTSDITYTAIPADFVGDDLDGSIYLDRDVTLTSSLTVAEGKTLNLCLNGHKLSANGADFSVITNTKGTLNLCDCNGSKHTCYGKWNAEKTAYTITDTNSDGADEIIGGVITGAKKNYHGGGIISQLGTTNLYSGTIAGNKVVNWCGGGGVAFNGAKAELYAIKIISNIGDHGGGLHIDDNSTVTMYGGEIKNNNSAYFGGGIKVCQTAVNTKNASFTLKGGEISGNTAGSEGGGIYARTHTGSKSNVTLNLQGGIIQNNITNYNGGGVFVGGDGDGTEGKTGKTIVNLSGNVTIKDNKKDENANNIYLVKGKTINITDALTNQTPMGITTETAPNEGTPVNITGSNSADYSDKFTSDNGDYEIVNTGKDSSQVVQLQKKLPKITAGANQEIPVGSTNDLTVKSDADFKDFQRVEVGKVGSSVNTLDESNYTKTEGSTIITLQNSYLKTLSAGTYNLNIVSATGTASTTFTIKPAGGGGGGGSSSYHYYDIKITKEGNGIISPAVGSDNTLSVRGQKDQTFTFTPDKGYVISDVLVDDKSIGAKASYTFENVAKDHTLKVIFKASSNDNVKPETSVSFEDVQGSNWFVDSVYHAVTNGWFSGTSKTTFSPYLSTTRGMIATVLWRMEKEPSVAATSIFEDVTSEMYYADGVNWAQANGIVDGYGNGKFGPADNITREQMASILYHYAKLKGYDVSKTASLDRFADGGTTSDYAKIPMAWAVANSLVSGKGNGILDPKGNATRAEAATILTRFDALFSEK